MVELTGGALRAIMNEETVEKPVLQVLTHRKVGFGAERYRLQVSDGQQTHTFAMLATQLNNLIHEGKLEANTVVQVDRYLRNKVKSGDSYKEVLVLLELTVLSPGSEVGRKLGNPVMYNPSASGAPAAENPPAASASSSEEPRSGFGHHLPRRSPIKNGPSTNPIGDIVPTHPINSLTPYQNKWTIRARVTNKTPVKSWSNSRGSGRLFSMDLVDKEGEIRATAFKDQCDKFYNEIEIGKVYYISKCSVKTANKQYSSLKNDYELTFTSETIVQPCHDGDDDLPTLSFNFVDIGDIEKTPANSIIDVVGVVKTCGDCQTITSRTTNRELVKRDIEIVDKNNIGVSLTMWAEQAEAFKGEGNPVVAIKGARVSDFNGKSLSTVSGSQIQVNPDIEQAHALRGWFDAGGANKATQSISQRSGGPSGGSSKVLTFAEAKMQNLGFEKPDYYSNKATVVLMRHENALYMACPAEGCNKKVTDMNNGMFRCEKCNKEYPNYNWRLLLSANLADMTDHCWVTCFQETGEALLGATAQEVGEAKSKEEGSEYTEIFQKANFKQMMFKYRVKTDTYNDETRLRTTLVSATPVDHVDYNRKLLAELKQLQGEV